MREGASQHCICMFISIHVNVGALGIVCHVCAQGCYAGDMLGVAFLPKPRGPYSNRAYGGKCLEHDTIHQTGNLRQHAQLVCACVRVCTKYECTCVHLQRRVSFVSDSVRVYTCAYEM